jgi:hypothetical protein
LGTTNDINVGKFLKAWRTALVELQRAYDDLVGEIHALILRAFNLSSETGRATIQRRARSVFENCIEPRLRAYAHHLAEPDTADAQWAEAIATMLIGKVPKTWIDADRARFEIALSEMARSFRHIETIVFEKGRRPSSMDEPARLIRLSITDEFSAEREAVATVEKRDRDVLAKGILRVREALADLGISEKQGLALAVLGCVAQEYIPEDKKAVEDSRLERSNVVG